jgi:hypothetical protein
MKIALVIPTYKPHFIYLNQLCKNIAEQTRLPDLVVIRASSCDCEAAKNLLQEVSAEVWPFPLQILDTAAQQYQAQNRNEGAAAVPPDFDVISFFDSDDLMHPRRLELLERLFLQGAEAVLHDCIMGETAPEWETYDTPPSHVWDSILLQKESAIQIENQIASRYEILKAYPGLILTGKEITFLRPIPMDEDLVEELRGTLGHVSIVARLLKTVRFDEDALGYEDAKFVSDIVFQRYRTATVRAKLSFYSVGSGLSVSTMTSSGSGYSE